MRGYYTVHPENMREYRNRRVLSIKVEHTRYLGEVPFIYFLYQGEVRYHLINPLCDRTFKSSRGLTK